MGKNYLYVSDSYDGWRNLATDEWFLDHIGPEDLVLYFYINQNAVIIGKNQNPWKECALSAMERDGVQLVRRISGGGAVFHDCGNLNFSFNAGKNRYDKDRQHRFILETVQSLGIPCEFSGRNDLLAAGKKFSGNAYCARGDAKQHHGTLLVSADLSRLQNYLTVDPRKMQSKGVASVRSRVCNLNEFVPSLTVEELLRVIPQAYGRVYGDFEPYPFTEQDRQEIEKYYKKHSSDEWRLGTTPPFDYEVDCRLSFGGVQILLSFEEGRVRSSKTYTDANDDTLAERIDRIFKGQVLDFSSWAEGLRAEQDQQLSELAEYIESLRS